MHVLLDFLCVLNNTLYYNGQDKTPNRWLAQKELGCEVSASANKFERAKVRESDQSISHDRREQRNFKAV